MVLTITLLFVVGYLLITVTVLIANFVADVLIGLLDPRIRAAQAREG